MEQSINELIAKLQAGTLSHPQFVTQMNKLQTPQQATQKKAQKTERAKKTKIYKQSKSKPPQYETKCKQAHSKGQ